MTLTRLLVALIALGGLAACEPPGAGDQEKYEYHKSNRESYLYQGL